LLYTSFCLNWSPVKADGVSFLSVLVSIPCSLSLHLLVQSCFNWFVLECDQLLFYLCHTNHLIPVESLDYPSSRHFCLVMATIFFSMILGTTWNTLLKLFRKRKFGWWKVITSPVCSNTLMGYGGGGLFGLIARVHIIMIHRSCACILRCFLGHCSAVGLWWLAIHIGWEAKL
jgi:hypothetical protein